MSSLGFQTVLYGFAALPEVLAERVFLEDDGENLLILDAGIQPLQVDLFAFSVSYENDYLNLLRILAGAGFPLRARERGADYPLVLAGGIAPTLNPEPLAAFVDLVVVGEGEELLGPLVEVLRRRAPSSGAKRKLLERLAALPGIYVPALYQPSYAADGCLAKFSPRPPAPRRVSRAQVRDLDAHPAVSRILAPGSQFENLMLIEINRGCGRGCRFCAAGHLYRPVRHRRREGLLASMEEASKVLERFGLLGSAVADHKDLLEVAREIVRRGWKFSLSSVRLDRLPPELLRLLREGGAKTITIAPEAGSERLRRAIKKSITDEQILEAAERIAEAGFYSLKLYFMLGLPTETPGDREAIPALIKKIRHRLLAVGRVRRRMGTIRVSLSFFVPKAWTPFQWHPFSEVRLLKAALSPLVRELRKIPNVTVTHEVAKWAYVQAILARGDRRAGDILESACRWGGDWGRAGRESAMNPDFFVHRTRERRELFPWDFIDTGLRKDRLWREYQRALAE